MEHSGPLTATEKQIVHSLCRAWLMLSKHRDAPEREALMNGLFVGAATLIGAIPGNHRPWLPDIWVRTCRRYGRNHE